MIRIEQIELRDPLYKQEQDLRNRILLQPIGLPDHAWEMDDHRAWHFVATEHERVIGCVILVLLDEERRSAQLKQMAVETDHQSKGIGRLLINKLLTIARENALKEIVCHARDTAIPFYEKNGFQVYDEPFMEVGVPHHHMRLIL